jgi:hypothetical protein
MPILSLLRARGRREQGIRYANLLVLIVAMLVVYPLFVDRTFGKAIFAAFNTLVIGSAAYAAADTRFEKILSACVGVPAVLVTWAGTLYPPKELLLLSYISITVFLWVVIVMLLKDILRRQTIRADTVYGAICVYLLLGIAWAGVYDVIEIVRPGSFQVSEALQVEGAIDWADTTYFSFVTLTTLGYGDISPVSRLAKTMAMLEAVTGVLYLATLIARLVSDVATSPRGDDSGPSAR